ncbi:hypothetical protein E8E12_004083 [Didymella heteroderae]|uniref:FAD-binding FR-type domain-containing protein n=1 Tax=Didymella heteroderae TaxID=1769908 RepID=A0A9P4WY30_9PLEO|nr:hypothetical protein E8E12_004083 [Didymella heteroderae]
MPDTSNEVDDVRYEHHLKHRGSANQKIFVVVWTSISVVLLFNLVRTVFTWWSRRTSREHRLGNLAPTRPSASRRVLAYIDAVAVLPFPQPLRRTFTGLSIGKIAALAAYSLVLVVLLLSVDAPISTPHFVDDVAFRAAWVTVTQIPLVFLLSSKHGLTNVLASASYERVLYLHKWTGRMIFVSATTHVVVMKSSISIADILLSQDTGTTIVRYGIGSYFLLIWIALSSVLPVRKWSYRTFYIGHWLSTLAFLMLIIQHVPKHALIPIYMAFGFVTIDKFFTLVLFARTNLSVRPLSSRLSKFRRGPGRARLIAGYQVEMLEPQIISASADSEESATAFRICNVPLKWRPGQHIRLYLPALGAFELHPFTPANCSNIAVPPPLPPRGSEDVERRGSAYSKGSSRQSSDILLMIRAHSGLTRRLKEFHTEWLKLPCPNATISPTTTSLNAYVDGPYGKPPCWECYENLILVVTSTGVSFALSIVDYLEQLCLSNRSKMKTRVIRFVWIMRHIDPQFEANVAEMLRRFGTILKDSGVRFETELHVTCVEADLKSSMSGIDQFAHLRPRLPRYGSGDRSLTIRNPDEIYDEWEEEERQWAEMEALEEMQMHEDANEISSVCCDEDATVRGYEGESYASSKCSTLLNGTSEQQEHRRSNTFSDVRLTVKETVALNRSRQLPTPVHSPLLPRRNMPNKQTCECALIQYQHEKLHRPRRSLFDSSSYGRRPDISYVVTSVLNSDQYSDSIVAVCANGAVSRQARTAVSRAKLAFARAQRATDVEIFVEGFS